MSAAKVIEQTRTSPKRTIVTPTDQLYCSIDLELTGFDPLKDEILEIGFALFKPTPAGLVITEEWSQVFRPSTEVHPKILGLTGITQTELEQAPGFLEFHDFLQDKLGNAIIVAHNVAMESKFLEAFGIKLSQKFIDTLDLVQFMLPTHHSYNLENLMHYYGISHMEAHRALADAKATIALLERLMQGYQSLSLQLQTQMRDISSKQGFLWQVLFDYPIAKSSGLTPSSSAHSINSRQGQENDPEGLQSSFSPSTISLLPFDETTPNSTAMLASKFNQPSLLAVPDSASVLRLWQQGLGRGIFQPDDLFDREKFQHLLRQELSVDQAKFVLKILVWLNENWQTESIVDLNLSFFGGQFRGLISGGPMPSEIVEQVAITDYQTFLLLSEQGLQASRSPIIWTSHKFEQWLVSGQQTRLTWNQALYLLKSIYNPETGFGLKELEKPVVDALIASDLFFGLVNMLMTKHYPGQHHVTLERLTDDTYVFNKIKGASEHFTEKVRMVTEAEDFFQLKKFIESFQIFFQQSPGYIKWIEPGETNCRLFNQPLHVSELAQKILNRFSPASFVETIPDAEHISYLSQRLGLAGQVQSKSLDSPSPINSRILSEKFTDQAALNLLTTPALPAAVLLDSSAEVKDFYKQHYVTLKRIGRVFAQGYSGGSNKIFRNFLLNKASIFLGTPEFLLRSQVKIRPATIILQNLPKVERDHPYQQALADFWSDKFPDFIVLQDRVKFWLLLQSLHSSELERLVVFGGSRVWAQQLEHSGFLRLE